MIARSGGVIDEAFPGVVADTALSPCANCIELCSSPVRRVPDSRGRCGRIARPVIEALGCRTPSAAKGPSQSIGDANTELLGFGRGSGSRGSESRWVSRAVMTALIEIVKVLGVSSVCTTWAGEGRVISRV